MSEMWSLLAENWIRLLLVGAGGLLASGLVVAVVAKLLIAVERSRK